MTRRRRCLKLSLDDVDSRRAAPQDCCAFSASARFDWRVKRSLGSPGHQAIPYRSSAVALTSRSRSARGAIAPCVLALAGRGGRPLDGSLLGKPGDAVDETEEEGLGEAGDEAEQSGARP